MNSDPENYKRKFCVYERKHYSNYIVTKDVLRS